MVGQLSKATRSESLVSMCALFFTKPYLNASLLLMLVTMLTSCTLPNAKKLPTAVPPSELQAYPNQESQPQPGSVDRKTNPIAAQQLKKAEEFYRLGMFLTPLEDNAFIRYRAVLMLEPNNRSASTGLDGILIHELGLVKDLLAESKYRAADKRVAELARYFPGAKALAEMKQKVDEARLAARQRSLAQKTVSTAKAEAEAQDDRIFLDADQLRAKDERLIAELASLAKKVEAADNGVLIYARSDAEGRWIYQTMRDATPEYRIRGDIRIGRPAIKLLSPFVD